MAPSPPLPLAWRYVAFAGMAAACAALGWIWIGAPPLLRAIGLAWALLGALRADWFFVSLALALPWMGDQPGSHERLTLLEFGLLGLTARHQLARALGVAGRPFGPLDRWIWLFAAYSWITVLNEWRYIDCEFAVGAARFPYVNLQHYGTSPTFGLQASFKLTLGAALYQAVRDRIWSPSQIRVFFGAAILAAALASLLGLGNYFGWFGLEWWRPENPDVAKFNFRRLQSLCGHPGWFAEYLAVVSPAAIAFALLGTTRGRRRLGWGLTGLFIPVQFLTMARGGWLGMAAGLTAAVAAASYAGGGEDRWKQMLRSAGWAVAGFAALAGAIYVVSPDFRNRLAGLFTASDRLGIWKAAYLLNFDRKLSGVGFGYFYFDHTLLYYPGHPWSHLDKVTSHNIWIHIWAERGLIGLTLFMGMLISAAKGMARGFAATGTTMALAAATGGLIAFLVDGIVQFPFYIRIMDILFWLLLGMTTWADPLRAASSPKRRMGWAAPAALLLFAAVFTAQNRPFDPWLIHLDMIMHNQAGRSVSLVVPAGRNSVGLRLGALQPDLENHPQTITARMGERVLAQETFTKLGSRRIEIQLPSDRLPGERLVLEASRVWRPLLDTGLRIPPLRKVGVIYLLEQ